MNAITNSGSIYLYLKKVRRMRAKHKIVKIDVFYVFTIEIAEMANTDKTAPLNNPV